MANKKTAKKSNAKSTTKAANKKPVKKVVQEKQVTPIDDTSKKNKIIAIIIAIIIIIALLLCLTCCNKDTDPKKLQGKVIKESDKKKKKDKEKKEKTITKDNYKPSYFTYTNNKEENNIITLAYNNDSQAVKDTTSPVARVTYSETKLTNSDVTIIIIANEKIKKVDDWTLSEDGKSLRKTVKENENGSISLSDLSGNKTEIKYEVNNIDKICPKIENVNNFTTYQVNVTPVITDENLDTIKLNDNEFVSGTEIRKNGQYKLIATDKAGNKSVVEFTIEKPLPVITVNENSKEIEYGSSYEIVKGYAKETEINPTIKYNGSEVESIDTTKPGDYELTYEYTDEDGNSAEPVVITITVKEPVMPENIKILDEASSELTTNEIELKIGDTKQLTISVLPENATFKDIESESSNPGIATIDETGKITAISEGNTQITIRSTKDQNVKRIINVKVSKVLAESIKISLAKTQLHMEETVTATANILPTNVTIKNVKWESSNPNVATVDASGKITAITDGNATITVTTQDGSNKSDSVNIVVNTVVNITNAELNSMISVGSKKTEYIDIPYTDMDIPYSYTKNITLNQTNELKIIKLKVVSTTFEYSATISDFNNSYFNGSEIIDYPIGNFSTKDIKGRANDNYYYIYYKVAKTVYGKTVYAEKVIKVIPSK